MLATGSDRRLFGIPQSITDDCVKTTSITCYMRQDRACASLANVDCMASPHVDLRHWLRVSNALVTAATYRGESAWARKLDTTAPVQPVKPSRTTGLHEDSVERTSSRTATLHTLHSAFTYVSRTTPHI